MFCPIWRKPYMTINADTYIHDMLAVSGGINVFGGAAKRYPEVTLDEVAATGAEVILLPDEPYRFRHVHQADFAPYPDLPAVRDGRMHLVDGKLLSWYGPRIAEALRVLPPLLGRRGPRRPPPSLPQNGIAPAKPALERDLSGGASRPSSPGRAARAAFFGAGPAAAALSSRIISISTGMPAGSEPMPTAERAWRPFSPNTSTIRSEKPLMTLGCSPKLSTAFTMPRTFTTRFTLSRLPSAVRAEPSRLMPTSRATL